MAAAPEMTPLMDGPCSGTRVELGAALSRRECERCKVREPRFFAPLVAPELVVTPPRADAGGEVAVRAVLRNRTGEPLELPFVWHAGPMFVVSAKDAAGQPAGEPKGPPPPSPGGFRPGPPYLVCITLAPGGVAYVERKWQAVQRRWVTTEPPLPGGPPPSEPAGPLPPGRYRLRLQTMLQVGGGELAIGAPSAWLDVARPR